MSTWAKGQGGGLGWPLLAGVLVSCGPGDGSFLDERGRSLQHPAAPGIGSQLSGAVFAPELRSIQLGFFERFCTECHTGAASPKGLDLSGPELHEGLVSRRSSQKPSLMLVEPGRSDRSYLVVKLEGGSGMVGRQMPRDRPARPPQEIDVIRAWIDQGAPRN